MKKVKASNWSSNTLGADDEWKPVDPQGAGAPAAAATVGASVRLVFINPEPDIDDEAQTAGMVRIHAVIQLRGYRE